MKKNTKIICYFLLYSMIVFLLAGCSSNDNISNKKLTVYSLYPSEDIEQNIIRFQNTNKSIKVKYEIGVEDKSKVSKSDAINKLNSELMSGNGPDIILLDGISKDYYVKKGLLYDMSPIINKNKCNILSNVYNNSLDNGKIYAMPLRLEYPAITGSDIEGINDLNSFAQAVENKASSSDKMLIDAYTPEEIINMFYYSSEGLWINKDNSINFKQIREFLENCKKIYNINEGKISDANLKEHEKFIEDFSKYSSKDGFLQQVYLNRGDLDSSVLFSNSPLYDIGYIKNIFQFVMLSSYDKLSKPVYYHNWKGNIGNYYLPSTIASINVKSNNKSNAKKLIQYLLNSKNSDISVKSGFTVNKKVLKELLLQNKGGEGENTIGNGKEDITVNVQEMTAKRADSIINNIEKLDVEADINTTILDQTKDDMINYMSGKINLDECINKIKSKIELLTSEN